MDNYIGEIRIFAGNFAPQDWALCNGQILQVSSNNALFSIVGTHYGGDGVRTFGLPDLQGAAPIGAGQSPGNSSYDLGQKAGATSATIGSQNLPQHSHSLIGDTSVASTSVAVNNLLGANERAVKPPLYDVAPTADSTKQMSAQMIGSSGSGWTGTATPFSIEQPTLALTYIIALKGIFPQRG